MSVEDLRAIREAELQAQRIVQEAIKGGEAAKESAKRQAVAIVEEWRARAARDVQELRSVIFGEAHREADRVLAESEDKARKLGEEAVSRRAQAIERVVKEVLGLS